jgi:serine/threonine-protein kinase
VNCTCDRCHTVNFVPDDQFQGTVLQVRCSGCGADITIDGKGTEPRVTGGTAQPLPFLPPLDPSQTPVPAAAPELPPPGDAAPIALVPGTQLDHRYEVVRLVGKGAMASVYLVRHLGLQSEHALKVLSPELATDPGLRARFVAEGRIQAQLQHPNIVHVTEIVTNPVAGLVMDYVQGVSLDAHLANRPPPPLTEVLELLLPVLDAVGAAHAFGVVHRDLKPENILVGRDARGRIWPRVTDFGIAKVANEAAAGSGRRTQAGARMGTLLYMSPEQVRGAEGVDARSDVFALGAILYETVTGRIAFDAPSEFETMKNIVEGQFVPPERVVGGLPPALASVIRKALAVSPAERFASCAEFRVALERSGDPSAQPLPKPTRSFAVTERPPPTAASPRLDLRTSAPDPLPKAPQLAPPRPRAPLEPVHVAQEVEKRRTPKGVATHLGFAAFSTVFCCFPIGLVAVVYAMQTSSRLDRGKREDAEVSSTNAATWSWLAVGTGAFAWFMLLRAVLGALGPHH